MARLYLPPFEALSLMRRDGRPAQRSAPEAEKLAEDEPDRAEAMQVLRDMETLGAW
jgi:hypothetical protein